MLIVLLLLQAWVPAVRRPRLLYVPFWVTYVFLYTPIVVLVVMSFNSGDSPVHLRGLQPEVVRRARRGRQRSGTAWSTR